MAPRYSPGDAATDVCNLCRVETPHTVAIADGDGHILRATCDVCGSQHPYRGGGIIAQTAAAEAAAAKPKPRAPVNTAPFPLVSHRERSQPPMSGPTHTSAAAGGEDLELLVRRVLREELGLTAVVPADKWRGGELVLRPGRDGVQEKSWPIESFFNKIVMLRNRLRIMEQHVNAAEISDELKLKLQTYITGCYGSLTSFNILFADPDDRFKGTGGKGAE